jgi:hypothetical protein
MPIITCQAKEASNLMDIGRSLQSTTALIFLESTVMPSLEITCPRKEILSSQNSHLKNLA